MHTHTKKKKNQQQQQQHSVWPVNRRNRKIKRWKRQKVGQKKEEENEKKKNMKIKIYEQHEPKYKKILLSWLKQSQMPTVT